MLTGRSKIVKDRGQEPDELEEVRTAATMPCVFYTL